MLDQHRADDTSSCSSDKVNRDSYGPDNGCRVGSNGLSIAFYPGGIIEVMDELQPEKTDGDQIKSTTYKDICNSGSQFLFMSRTLEQMCCQSEKILCQGLVSLEM